MPAVIKGPRPRTATGFASSVESSSIKTKRTAKARPAVASSTKPPKRKP